jgi:benzodiazapine receptor
MKLRYSQDPNINNTNKHQINNNHSILDTMMEPRRLLLALALLFGAPSGVAAFTCRPQLQTPAIREHARKATTTLDLTSSPVAWAVGHAFGGLLAAPVVAKAKGWYKKIDLPPWTPPDRVFGPVWTILYSSMGVAAARVYQRTQSLSSPPMVLWMVHYFLLNLPWAPVFFGMKRLRLGMVLNTLMLASLGIIIPLFYQNNPLSGLLLLPYLAWLISATVLNSAICRRNPTKHGYNEAMFQAGLLKLQKAAAEYAGV